MSSSFVVIGVPLFFIVPYLTAFVLFLIISLKYSDKLLRFSKDENDNLIANFESVTHISYIISTISRIIISLIVIALRVQLLQLLGIEYTPYIIFQEPEITLIILITIIFDLLLLSSKGIMVGMHRRMLAEYKHHLSRKRGK
ncbi:hypothetical protein [Candidatus Nitrosocosmicus franklandus]|uniref:hypothetical protein n=1 Tax=Candidatus Nitrosocosmicus franklandianus TaxID=1798806 RepID=UPI001559B221|nr:hypothetical protein [Candidatus Nitrosocosmicus franklandus]